MTPTLICSICGTEANKLTAIQGTLICAICLKKVTEEAKSNEAKLIASMAEQIIKENSIRDVYD